MCWIWGFCGGAHFPVALVLSTQWVSSALCGILPCSTSEHGLDGLGPDLRPCLSCAVLDVLGCRLFMYMQTSVLLQKQCYNNGKQIINIFPSLFLSVSNKICLEIAFVIDYLILKMAISVATFIYLVFKIIQWISAWIRTGFSAAWNGLNILLLFCTVYCCKVVALSALLIVKAKYWLAKNNWCVYSAKISIFCIKINTLISLLC